MYAQTLSLKNYRNIQNEQVSFTPGVNFLYGENAQGKTNILEALYFYARGKSFRGATDKEQTSFGCDGYETSLTFQDSQRSQVMSYRYCKGEKVRQRNGMNVDRATEFLGHFRAVLFFPDDLEMVKDGPEARRNFLNVAISQCNSSYVKYYATYKRCLEQRNALIKYAQKNDVFDEEQLYAWSDSLASSAALIHLERKRYLSFLSGHTQSFIEELSKGKEKIDMTYESAVEGESRKELYESYKKVLTENWRKEFIVGYSLYGIHRDDVDLKINGRSARLFASQGQQRTIVLSLKMAEGAVCRELTGEEPVFLLDDVLSELDEKRRRFFLEEISGPQILMTGCDKSLFSSDKTNIIEVKGGQYVSAHR